VALFSKELDHSNNQFFSLVICLFFSTPIDRLTFCIATVFTEYAQLMLFSE